MKITGTEAKQSLRMHRFLMAVATYAACGALAQLCAWLGYLPSSVPIFWVAGTATVNLFFYFMIRSGKNLRLSDPSMTEPQLHLSMLAAMALISQADDARGALLMLLPVPLIFGILRLNFHQITRVAVVGILMYVSTIYLIWFYQPQRINFTLELLSVLTLATVMAFVCLLCGYISNVRVSLASAIKKIDDLAHRDALTGLFNRRHLMEILEVTISHNRRQQCRSVTLCMIDLDHFKQVNDTFGHVVGDEVLVQVGNCLTSSSRDIDSVIRYGGEEFVVLLDAASDDLAISICERIRANVQELRIPALQGRLLSVSIGLANMAVGESALRLIERADKALYLAKSDGRNRVHAASHTDVLSDVQKHHLTCRSKSAAAAAVQAAALPCHRTSSAAPITLPAHTEPSATS
jgi:diguanylate cyclase (GGDEF)-like protein